MRLTPQRMAVIRTLIESKEHLRAEDVYQRVRVDYPMIGLATVYKTISMLKELGEISELNFSSTSARFDGNGKHPHPHFVCNRCHRIFDMDEKDLEDLAIQIAQNAGYTITSYRLDFFGICKSCQRELSAATNPVDESRETSL